MPTSNKCLAWLACTLHAVLDTLHGLLLPRLLCTLQALLVLACCANTLSSCLWMVQLRALLCGRPPCQHGLGHVQSPSNKTLKTIFLSGT